MKIHSCKSIILFCIGIVSICSSVDAQTDPVNVVTTAVPFLRISADARAGGMGDAGIATSPDINAQFLNLAKTPFNKMGTAIGVTYTPWLKDLGLNDVFLASLAGYRQITDDQAFSYSMRYFSLGNIQFTDYSGNLLNSYNPKEFAIDFGYSRKLSPNLGLGVALRYINSALATGTVNGVSYKAGNAVAGDVSLYYTNDDKTGAGLSWGITLSNLGSKIGYTNDAQNKDFIPANLGLGVAYTSVFDQNSKLTFALDVNKLLVPAAPVASNPTNASLDSANLAEYKSMSVMSSWLKSFADGTNQLKSFQASLGAEYSYNDQFMVRAGYFFESPERGNRKYFSVGVGLKYDAIGINFSYLVPSGNGITRNPLSNTLRLGLSFDLEPNDSHKN
jgi:hypothetical protein